MPHKVFISGGLGFIGSAIVNHFQKTGHQLLIYDDLSFGSRDFVRIHDHEFVEGNILDQTLLNKTMDRFSPDIVLHLAAIHFIPYCNAHPFESANINIKGTLNVMTAAKRLGNLGRFFFASTAAVYPVWDFPIHESLAARPMDIYGLSKLSGEISCQAFHHETSVPTIVCRFFNAFGPNETNPHLIPAIQKQVLEGRRVIKLGNITPKRDFIHTDDMASGILQLLEKAGIGLDTFNLGQGIEYSVTEVVKAFEKAAGYPIEIEIEPALVRKSDRPHLVADIKKITELTGWRPLISLEEGIKTLMQ